MTTRRVDHPEIEDMFRIVTGRGIMRGLAPYFSDGLEAMPVKPLPGLGTFAVTQHNVILVDYAFSNNCILKKVAFCLGHEFLHRFHRHAERAARMGIRMDTPDGRLWNKCGDAFINMILQAIFNGWAPDDAVLFSHLGVPDDTTTAEAAFEFLKRKQQEEAEKQQQQEEDGEDEPEDAGGTGSGGEDEDGEDEPGQDGEPGEDDQDGEDAPGGTGEPGEPEDGEDPGEGPGEPGESGEPEPGEGPQDGPGQAPGEPGESGADGADQPGQGGPGAPGDEPPPSPEWSPPAPCSGHCGSGCGGASVPGEPGKEDPSSKSDFEMEAAIKQVALAIVEAVKTQGNVPAALGRLAAETLEEPEVPWQQRLSQLVRNAAGRQMGKFDRAFHKPSLLQGSVGYGHGKPILPEWYRPTLKVDFVFDTSASMNDAEIGAAKRECRAIIDAIGGEVFFVSADAEVQTQGKAKRVEDITLGGGGGTDFRPYFDSLVKRSANDKPNVIVYATDGYGQAPSVAPRNIDVIWLGIGAHSKRPSCAEHWGEFIQVKEAKKR